MELEESSQKFQFISDFLDKQKKKTDKVILVSYFKQTLDVLAEMMKRKEILYQRIDGSVHGNER